VEHLQQQDKARVVLNLVEHALARSPSRKSAAMAATNSTCTHLRPGQLTAPSDQAMGDPGMGTRNTSFSSTSALLLSPLTMNLAGHHPSESGPKKRGSLITAPWVVRNDHAAHWEHVGLAADGKQPGLVAIQAPCVSGTFPRGPASWPAKRQRGKPRVEAELAVRESKRGWIFGLTAGQHSTTVALFARFLRAAAGAKPRELENRERGRERRHGGRRKIGSRSSCFALCQLPT
jgi:hypothetical protein